MKKSSSQLYLDDNLLIGKGKVRNVYQHPTDPDKCIKITFNKDRNRSVKREIRYLRLYQRRKKPFEHLVRFHGYCTTNRGPGAEFDLIRDHDGDISTMLSRHVTGEAENSLQPEEIVALLLDLYHHLLSHNIIICDPAPNNLLVHYQEPEKPKLVIVDGIGNPHFIKIADFSKYYAHKLINKKWRYYIEDNLFLKDIFAATNYRKRTG